MSPQEMSDLADEFFKDIDRKIAEIQENEPAHDYERVMAVNEILRQSYRSLEEVKKWVESAVNLEPDRKRAHLLMGVRMRIDDAAFYLEELL